MKSTLSRNWPLFAITFLTLSYTAKVSGFAQPRTAETPSDPVRGFASVKPILEANCVRCHGGKIANAGLDLRFHRTTMIGSDYGGVVMPGQPDDSILTLVLRNRDGHPQMPPINRLPNDEIRALEAWVRNGAKR
jgi:mono/diheme cytochrome c family protein